ncbi:hypothetical protein H5181_18645 [Shewanella sp. SG44-2]|nr:hypothetical protein [Shewanella sp. SG44-2]
MINDKSKSYNLISSILLIVFCYILFENYFVVSMKTNGLDKLYYSFSLFKLVFLYGTFLILLLSGILKASFEIRTKTFFVILYIGILIYIGYFVKGNGTMVMLSIQNMYFWIFLLSLLYVLPGKPHTQFFKTLMPVMVVCLLIHFIYSLWIQTLFNGDYNLFYFYELYSNLEMFGSWNHLKDGDVRAYGFFGSSTGLSQVLLIPICYLIACCMLKKKSKILYFLFFIIFIYFLFITRIRNPALSLCFVVLLLSLLKLLKISSFRSIITVFVFLFIFSFAIAPLSDLLGIGDLSSQARTPMLLSFIDNITANPIGYGIGSTGNLKAYQFFYESSFATIVNDLGFFYSIPLFSFLLILIASFYRVYLYGTPTHKLIGLTGFLSLSSLFFLMNYSNIFDFTLNIYIIFLYSCFSVFKIDKVRLQ